MDLLPHQKGTVGMKEFAKTFYSSKNWADCRAAYRKSVGGLCELCLKSGIIKAGEIVHHKKPLTPSNINDPNITLNWENLQLLCREHHAEVHEQGKRRYTVDKNGKVTSRGT